MERNISRSNLLSIDNMAKMAIFAAISGVLMLFKFPLPFAPSFMTVDFADIGTLMSGFILGPVSGVLTVILKNLINLMLNGTTTAYVGELSNTIIGISFVLVSSLVYNRKKTMKGALLGLGLGILVMTAIATLSNYFIIFPMYGKIMGKNLDEFAQFVPLESVKNFKDMLVISIIPFNLVKGFLNALVTFLTYKKVSRLMKKY
ncbi:ECF transporter S component [uncultured Helcococcus sp.]|uniref:ECF transporter S component n=1 Tax=uncultured Helcococcus sp. TaxID=1072508 RepID=UPI00260B955B|nr:ECF transporter S component [uncultured Helcococcus sp.]